MVRIQEVKQNKTHSKTPSAHFSIILVSCIISIFIGLQVVAAFSLSCSDDQGICDPELYPFLAYPMYMEPKYEGDAIDQFFLFGTLEDSTEVSVRAEDLNLDFWLFTRNFVVPIRENEYEKVQLLVEEYEKIHHKQIVSLRLEKRPLSLFEDGLKPGSSQVVKVISMDGLKD